MVSTVFVLQLVTYVIENQEDGFNKVGTESGWPFIRFWLAMFYINYYMLGTTTELSMPFQVLGFWLHLKEVFILGLDLTVTEINIKKLSYAMQYVYLSPLSIFYHFITHTLSAILSQSYLTVNLSH